MSLTTNGEAACPVKGDYAPSTPSDLRSPCPLINCLANHGYISRSGRDVHAPELIDALRKHIGLSVPLSSVFSNPIFLERAAGHVLPGEQQVAVTPEPKPKRSFLQYLWYLVRNPWALLFSAFGMRRPGQVDAQGRKCLDLDQLALPSVVEHDISVTRRDFLQPEGNNARQPDLVRDLLEVSSDGKTFTEDELVQLRRKRIAIQKAAHKAAGQELKYGSMQHGIACTEMALVLNVFGDGKSVPFSYVKAFFEEERLPVKEGWQKRRWWRPLGIIELVLGSNKFKALVGPQE